MLAKARAAAAVAVRRRLAPPPRAASVPQSRQSVPPRRPSKQLLLIDSEPAFGTALSGWMARTGDFEVVQATSLKSAVTMLRGTKVDLIIASASLPDGSSLSLLQDAALNPIPKLFLTEQALEDRAKVGREVHLLEKPVSPSSLRDELRALFMPPPPTPNEEEATGPITIPSVG